MTSCRDFTVRYHITTYPANSNQVLCSLFRKGRESGHWNPVLIRRQFLTAEIEEMMDVESWQQLSLHS